MCCASGAWREIDPYIQCLKRSGKLQDEVLLAAADNMDDSHCERMERGCRIRTVAFCQSTKIGLPLSTSDWTNMRPVHTAVNISSIRVPESRWKELESCFDLLARGHEGFQAHLADALGSSPWELS